MERHVIYIGNLPENADLRRLLPPQVQLDVQHTAPPAAGVTIYLEDASTAQQVAQALDGRQVDGQAISAIPRTRLEEVLDAARRSARRVTVMALARRLGATSPDMLRCLQRLVTFFGTEIVTKAVDQASNRADACKTPLLDEYLDNLLCPLHPVVAQALRCGSLRQAERRLAEPRQKGEKDSCESIANAVTLEFGRRMALMRRARRELTRLYDSGTTDGSALAIAHKKDQEADLAVCVFQGSLDISAGRTSPHARRRRPVNTGRLKGM